MRQTSMQLSQTALIRCWALGVAVLCAALAFGACGSDPIEVDDTGSAAGRSQVATTEPIELAPTAAPETPVPAPEDVTDEPATQVDGAQGDESAAQVDGAQGDEPTAQSDGAQGDESASQSDGAQDDEPAAQADGAQDDEPPANPTPASGDGEQSGPVEVSEGVSGETNGDEAVTSGPIGDDGAWSPLTPRNDLSGEQSSTPEDVLAGPDGNTILVRFWGGAEPCFGARVEIMETADRVEVQLITGLPPGAEFTSCIAIAVAYEIEAPLNSPLGDRPILAVTNIAAPGVPDDGAVFSTGQYLGLLLAEAEELAGIEGRVFRIARVDDERFALTEDYDPSRVNVEVEDGRVVAAEGG